MQLAAAGGRDERRVVAWRAAAGFVVAGALVMFAGLMLGPTPGTDPADALRRIDDTRTLYVATNGVDLIGVALLGVGLLLVARLLASGVDGVAEGAVGGVAAAVGTTLVAVVLVIQTAVDPGIAGRFVSASGAEAATQLAVGRAFLDFEGGLFGIAIMAEMTGIACLAAGLARQVARGLAPHVDARVALFGAAIAGLAAVTGVGFFADGLAWLERIEALCSLATLVWLVVAGVLLYRAARAPRTPGVDVSLSLRVR